MKHFHLRNLHEVVWGLMDLICLSDLALWLLDICAKKSRVTHHLPLLLRSVMGSDCDFLYLFLFWLQPDGVLSGEVYVLVYTPSSVFSSF